MLQCCGFFYPFPSRVAFCYPFSSVAPGAFGTVDLDERDTLGESWKLNPEVVRNSNFTTFPQRKKKRTFMGTENFKPGILRNLL